MRSDVRGAARFASPGEPCPLGGGPKLKQGVSTRLRREEGREVALLNGGTRINTHDCFLLNRTEKLPEGLRRDSTS